MLASLQLSDPIFIRVDLVKMLHRPSPEETTKIFEILQHSVQLPVFFLESCTSVTAALILKDWREVAAAMASTMLQTDTTEKFVVDQESALIERVQMLIDWT